MSFLRRSTTSRTPNVVPNANVDQAATNEQRRLDLYLNAALYSVREVGNGTVVLPSNVKDVSCMGYIPEDNALVNFARIERSARLSHLIQPGDIVTAANAQDSATGTLMQLCDCNVDILDENGQIVTLYDPKSVRRVQNSAAVAALQRNGGAFGDVWQILNSNAGTRNLAYSINGSIANLRWNPRYQIVTDEQHEIRTLAIEATLQGDVGDTIYADTIAFHPTRLTGIRTAHRIGDDDDEDEFIESATPRLAMASLRNTSPHETDANDALKNVDDDFAYEKTESYTIKSATATWPLRLFRDIKDNARCYFVDLQNATAQFADYGYVIETTDVYFPAGSVKLIDPALNVYAVAQLRPMSAHLAWIDVAEAHQVPLKVTINQNEYKDEVILAPTPAQTSKAPARSPQLAKAQIAENDTRTQYRTAVDIRVDFDSQLEAPVEVFAYYNSYGRTVGDVKYAQIEGGKETHVGEQQVYAGLYAWRFILSPGQSQWIATFTLT